MVRWLDPHQLLDTSARVLASRASSRRTRTAASCRPWPRPDVYDRSDRGEVWLDYVSDLGDGWNSTYTVARLLAQDKPRADHPTRFGGKRVRRQDNIARSEAACS